MRQININEESDPANQQACARVGHAELLAGGSHPPWTTGGGHPPATTGGGHPLAKSAAVVANDSSDI